jgi:hypothetical protein
MQIVTLPNLQAAHVHRSKRFENQRDIIKNIAAAALFLAV